MKKLIELIDFSITLGDRILYDKVNLSLYEGDKYIFLGPNGVGKSLLLELLAFGYTGEIKNRFRGINISGHVIDSEGNDILNPRSAIRQKVSFVAQNEDFYNNSTIYDEAETACHGIGIPLDEDKLDYFLNRFGIVEKKNQKIKNNISFGEGKIIHLITRLLKLKEANILLLDEPLNHLSFQNSKILNDIILDEVEKNRMLCIIMISHCRAMSFTDKALVYNREKKNLLISQYNSYDCFSTDYASECEKANC